MVLANATCLVRSYQMETARRMAALKTLIFVSMESALRINVLAILVIRRRSAIFIIVKMIKILVTPLVFAGKMVFVSAILPFSSQKMETAISLAVHK